jgi:hypothetical protein
MHVSPVKRRRVSGHNAGHFVIIRSQRLTVDSAEQTVEARALV